VLADRGIPHLLPPLPAKNNDLSVAMNGGWTVFFNDANSEAERQAEAEFTMGLFLPGDIVQTMLQADRNS
jgi:hypothetical protein